MYHINYNSIQTKQPLQLTKNNFQTKQHNHMATIKIVEAKRGVCLQVNGLFISHGFDCPTFGKIKAIKCEQQKGEAPYGATEWISVTAVREFWHKFMPTILKGTEKPCVAKRGKIVFVEQ